MAGSDRATKSKRARSAEGPSEVLERAFGYTFREKALLAQALTHKSFANETGGAGSVHADNERLEFLGDSVLGFAVASLLYEAHPDVNEGELTRQRSAIVCEPTLAKKARDIGIDEAMRLGRGEDKSGGRDKPRLLSSTLEACIGAIYVDGGADAAYRTASSLFQAEIAGEAPTFADHKSLLQEELQATIKVNPSYQTLAVTGPDHAKVFEVGVFAADKLLARAEGSSKVQAEQNAAATALEELKQND